jgi:hypothetical protein
MWRNQMSVVSRHVAIAAFGMGLAICASTASMAAAEMMCGSAALGKLDQKARQTRIEECRSQTPVLDSETLIAPIPTVVAARGKGPKLRDKHLRAACPLPKIGIDALTVMGRKEGPKGAGESGCTDLKLAPDVPLLKRRKGPKGDVGSDHQG